MLTVSFDKPEDREKLAKAIKDNRLAFPVYFEGKAAKPEFASKLNVTSAPRLAVFGQNGILLSNNVPMGQLEPAVKKLLDPPKKGTKKK